MKETIVEKIKKESNNLRGTLKKSIENNLTGEISDSDKNIIKFHGMYQQDDRDVRKIRKQKKLENLYSFMIRLRLPGGFLTAPQWIATNEVAKNFSTEVIKITTRQTIQLHGIFKSHVKPTIQAFNLANLDSIATCGDINRNVTCNALPTENILYEQIFLFAEKISKLLMPKTKAYYEIWLDKEMIYEKKEEIDELYKDAYLPRKFKIGIAIPPNNDVDVFTNDIGLIAIIENNTFIGFNIAVGGGLSFTHGNEETYPRLANIIGFVSSEEKILKTIYEIVTIQRDYGDRTDRKKARLKYTLDKMGTPQFIDELEKRMGFKLAPQKDFYFNQRTDTFGWNVGFNGLWHYTCFVECGRITNENNHQTKDCLYEIAQLNICSFKFTCNQNIIITDVHPNDKDKIDNILIKYNVKQLTQQAIAIRLGSIACVAFNTCPLALAEAQRYLPHFITKLEPILIKHNLINENISLRITGCPNGCGRSTVAEIGLIGTAYNTYNLHLGGDKLGLRLNKLYKENLQEEGILNALDFLFNAYNKDKLDNESFGDFCFRNY